MAHGDKKWIRDWRGRLKRSRNRTQTDWLAELNAPAVQKRLWRNDKLCPQCKHLNKFRLVLQYRRREPVTLREYHRRHPQVYGTLIFNFTYARLEERIAWDWHDVPHDQVHLYDRTELFPQYHGRDVECRACREKHNTLWHGRHNGDETRRHSRGGRKWQKRQQWKERRAETRMLLENERYEDIPTRYRYNWWRFD